MIFYDYYADIPEETVALSAATGNENTGNKREHRSCFWVASVPQ